MAKMYLPTAYDLRLPQDEVTNLVNETNGQQAYGLYKACCEMRKKGDNMELKAACQKLCAHLSEKSYDKPLFPVVDCFGDISKPLYELLLPISIRYREAISSRAVIVSER